MPASWSSTTTLHGIYHLPMPMIAEPRCGLVRSVSIVRIALANLVFPATPDDSVALATAAIARAVLAGVQIVCFPECYVPG